ncbi:MAG: periplasmic solute-binding protein, UPF0755 protein [Candidatus Peregrinibacteria bacterium GW2011_GWE2_39_6]|nr:MAG: periplasmic solute-binding protein, UPF0755 protein [Candidatus Peregrinibacteria bacterium GW2011_GWF2_39_17]KKR26807.1 MAG: periplasmic solute-binding protein, UPF0755 protein [Candidatus Peregrinibacteria bacterium GW2011_GWE2_39_6]HCW32878.1 endolytic transglycosylase MltG [Candidatus Peregrinibacteria bacterium]
MLPNKKIKATYLKIIFLTIIVLLSIKGIAKWYNHWLQTPLTKDKNSPTIIVDIKPGTSGKEVARKLQEEELISNFFAFYWYLRQEKIQIQNGRFVLSPNMSPLIIIDNITSGKGLMAITIPEGWTMEKIDEKLTEMALIQPKEFINCAKTCDFKSYPFLKNASSLEGYLFPDTFFIDPTTFQVKEFIERLLDNFEKKVLTPDLNTVLQNNNRSLKDLIIMASIVEREASWDEDRPIVAGILWKRLDNDWALEADATLLYVTGGNILTAKDLQLDSPYNTRKYHGLPPTAISNPGLAAIKAALKPQTTDYWFYLNDAETGKAHYGSTNAEHEANKKTWL